MSSLCGLVLCQVLTGLELWHYFLLRLGVHTSRDIFTVVGRLMLKMHQITQLDNFQFGTDFGITPNMLPNKKTSFKQIFSMRIMFL